MYPRKCVLSKPIGKGWGGETFFKNYNFIAGRNTSVRKSLSRVEKNRNLSIASLSKPFTVFS